MALTLYANPYDTSVKGFYFKDAGDYEKKAEKSRAEEFEIEFIDGDDEEQMLFKAMGVHQGNIEEYFDLVDDLDEEEILKLKILMEDIGYDFDDAMDKKDDLIVYHGYKDDEDFAIGFVEEMGGIENALGDQAESYFDFDSFGRDLRMEGYGQTWTVEWKTADDEGELDETFSDYDEAQAAGEAWQEEAEDDEEENPSFEVVEGVSDQSDQDIGEEYVDSMGGVGELDKDTQERYFDWTTYARDLMMDMGESDGVYYDPRSV